MLFRTNKQVKNASKLQTRTLQWKKILQMGLFSLGLISSTQSFAQSFAGAARSDGGESVQNMQEAKDIKGKGWQLKSEGGLTFVHPQDESFWVNVGGTVRLDQVLYSGDFQDRQTQFPSSARIRRAEFGLDGGVGKDWEYTFTILSLGLSQNGGSIVLQDCWLGYTGLWEKSELFLGRVSGNWYGMENSSGSTWMPFLERSAQANAFYPGDGIGVMADKWWEDGGVTALAIQPDQGFRTIAPTTPVTNYRSDRWRLAGRATYAPVHCLGDVWHFGVSGAWRRNDPTLWGILVQDIRIIGLAGGVYNRNPFLSAAIFNTGFLSTTYVNQWSVEAARQWGPFIAEAEYSELFVHRVNSPYGSLRFKGWDIQARYTITGEIHKYDVRDGNFGSLEICSPYGAWEIAARYDYLSLNDKDIHGGSQSDFTLGLNWFYNPVLRVSANYIRANLHPNHLVRRVAPVDRQLNVFAFRIQIRFK